jgi:glycosyltransferase involved in cell wall biosynthesis
MMQPLLSICIPTYNRREYLETSLSEIAKQAAEFPDKVEVIVINNNSTDTTEYFIAGLHNRYPKIRYFRNDKNLGGERNHVRCLEEATGEYAWLFGDDEIMVPGGIANVIESLRNKRWAYHILLGNLRDNDPTEDQLYPSYQNFIKERGTIAAIDFTFLSRWIFRRSLWDMEVAREKVPTRFNHAYAIRKNGGVLVLNKPVIRIRPVRAPLHDTTNAEHLWLNFNEYLKYIGVPLQDRMIAIWQHKVEGTVRRYLGQCRDAVIGNPEGRPKNMKDCFEELREK